MLYEIEGIKIFIDENKLSPSDSSFGAKLSERLKNGEWEAEEFEMLNTMPRDCVVLELGACIGFISCATNRLLKNKQSHVVVEANTNLIEILENNRAINDAKFTIQNCIVSDEKHDIDFHVDKRSILGSSTEIEKNRVYETLKVQTKTIEELENELDLKFDALICDIEGGEYKLFSSLAMKEKIKSLRFISIEFHWNVPNSREMCNEIISLIEKEGFNVRTFMAKTGQKQLFATKQ